MTLTIFVGPSIVIKHGTLGNLRAKCALKSEHHLTKWVIFQLAMFDYQRVYQQKLGVRDQQA